jgi:hypothetical protein
MKCFDDDSKGNWNMNSLNSYCKRWPHELNTILIWISIYNILGPVIAMCASFLKTFAWCKFGPGGLNVPSVTLKLNSYLFCDLWVIDDLGTRCYCNVNYLFIMQRRCPIAIDYVNLGWLNLASWPLSSIVIGYANYGMICVIHITDMVKCRLDDIVMCEHFIQNI